MQKSTRGLLTGATCCALFSILTPSLTAAAARTTDDSPVVLEPFEVVDAETEGYHVSSASTATRTNTPLIEIPQTVNIVTASFMKDIGATTFQDSFRYVPNAFVRDRNAGFGSVNLRGFENPGGFSTDGIRISPYKRDMAGYERLEVVKGPPSAVQGRGGIGGLLNYILKKPVYDRDFTNLSATVSDTVGTGPGYRGYVDWNRALSEDLAYRVVAVGEQRDDYVEMMEHKIIGLYPSFRWKPFEKTEIILANELLRTNTPSREEGHGFIVHPGDLRRHLDFDDVLGAADQITGLNIPYNFQSGGPDNTWKEDTAVMNLFINQKINENLDYRQAINFRYYSRDWVSHNIQNNTARFQNITREHADEISRGATLQGDFVARYRFNFVSTSTLLGYQWQEEWGFGKTQTATPADPAYARLDLLAASQDPRGYFSRPREVVNEFFSRNDTSKSKNLGLYVQQDLGFFDDRLNLSGGIRSDQDYSNTVRRASGGSHVVSDTSLNSWRVGATYKIAPRLVAYGVHSTQNDPPYVGGEFAVVPDGDPRRDIVLNKPRTNELTEFGVKGDFLNNKLTLTLAWWELSRTNNFFTLTFDEAFTDAGGLPQTRAITQRIFADAKTSGIEFEAFGNLTNRLSVIASYVNMNSDEANPLVPGETRPLRFAPEWSSNLFLRYSFRDNDGRGWVFRAGTNWVGPVTLQIVNGGDPLAPGGRYRLPKTQHTFDLGASYSWDRYEMDLQVNNVASDYIYITRSNPPRNVRLSLTASF